MRRTAEALWGFDTQPALYLHKLAIRHDLSTKGLGAELLRFGLNQAQSENLDYVRLDCVASNRALRDYYERHGFRLARVENNGEVDLALYQLPLERAH